MRFTEELTTNYREVRRRLRAVPAMPARVVEVAPEAIEILPAIEYPTVPAAPVARDWLRVDAPPLLREILHDVAKKHGITVGEMCGPDRFKRPVAARKEYCYRAMRETDKSGEQIARMISRDRTTVLWSVQSYCKVNNKPLPRGMVVSCRMKLMRYKGGYG